MQWDQRAGEDVRQRNGRASAETVIIDQLVQDGIELADTLRTSLRKDKIILRGHSWGSVLGVLIANRRGYADETMIPFTVLPRKCTAAIGQCQQSWKSPCLV